VTVEPDNVIVTSVPSVAFGQLEGVVKLTAWAEFSVTAAPGDQTEDDAALQ
jgi:hypothetical protein